MRASLRTRRLGATTALGAALAALGLLACPPPGDACRDDRDCPAGQLCVDGQCRQACNRSADCAAGLECRDGLCVPRRDAAGAPDAAAGEGGSADRRAASDAGAQDLGSADGGGPDTRAPVDASASDTAGFDRGPAVDAADPCQGVSCPQYTTCAALADGTAVCLCGDRACGDSELCRPADLGSSAPPRCCGAAQLNCDGVCRNVLEDEQNCGGCNVACAHGELCVQAQCACGGAGSCDPATQDCCSGICTGVLVDADHCGPLGTGIGCSVACPGELPCVDGLCRCATDSDCGHGVTCCEATYCADLASDLRNCRACGTVCAPGEVCGATGCTCSATCDDGEPCTEDRCVQGRCTHVTLDGDDDGYCALGCPDARSGQVGDCVDGDCDDADPDVHPGAAELCDGKDSDCNAVTVDGAAQCPGLCCGTPRACRDCCTAAQCGAGSWECSTSWTCHCDGLDCGGHCYVSGACCDVPNACGGCTTLSHQPGAPCGTCGSYQCQGTDAVICSGDVAVDGGWSSFSYTAWSDVGTCGQHAPCKQKQTRTGTRTCTNPAPSCGGAACVGDASVVEERELDCGLVNGGWSAASFGAWSALGTCGQFVPCIQRETRSGTRTCTNPAPACGGAPCEGSATVTETRDSLACGLVNGGWSAYTYSNWSLSGDCGQYVSCRQREVRDGTRTCTNPAPACGGAACTGAATTIEARDELVCGVVNGDWSDWSEFGNWYPVDSGACDTTPNDCSQEVERMRTRSCSSPAPVCGGADCAGSDTDTERSWESCPDSVPCDSNFSYQCCQGSCINTDWDLYNCGYCGNDCTQQGYYSCNYGDCYY